MRKKTLGGQRGGVPQEHQQAAAGRPWAVHAGPHHAAGGENGKAQAGPEKMHVRQWHVRSQLHGAFGKIGDLRAAAGFHLAIF